MPVSPRSMIRLLYRNRSIFAFLPRCRLVAISSAKFRCKFRKNIFIKRVIAKQGKILAIRISVMVGIA